MNVFRALWWVCDMSCSVMNMSVLCVLWFDMSVVHAPWWIWTYFMYCNEHQRISCILISVSVCIALWWIWAYFMHCGEYGVFYALWWIYERILCTVVNMAYFMRCGEYGVFYALWWIWRILCTVVNMAYFMHCGEYERILCTVVNISVFCALWWTWACFVHCGEHERVLCTVVNMSVFCALWWTWACFVHFNWYERSSSPMVSAKHEHISCTVVNMTLSAIISCIVMNVILSIDALWWIWAYLTLPFLSERSPLWTHSSLTRRCLFFRNNRPAKFPASRCYLPWPQVPVCYLFKLVVNNRLCIVLLFVCASGSVCVRACVRACVCVCVFSIIVCPDKILRCRNTFLYFMQCGGTWGHCEAVCWIWAHSCTSKPTHIMCTCFPINCSYSALLLLLLFFSWLHISFLVYARVQS